MKGSHYSVSISEGRPASASEKNDQEKREKKKKRTRTLPRAEGETRAQDSETSLPKEGEIGEGKSGNCSLLLSAKTKNGSPSFTFAYTGHTQKNHTDKKGKVPSGSSISSRKGEKSDGNKGECLLPRCGHRKRKPGRTCSLNI